MARNEVAEQEGLWMRGGRGGEWYEGNEKGVVLNPQV